MARFGLRVSESLEEERSKKAKILSTLLLVVVMVSNHFALCAWRHNIIDLYLACAQVLQKRQGMTASTHVECFVVPYTFDTCRVLCGANNKIK